MAKSLTRDATLAEIADNPLWIGSAFSAPIVVFQRRDSAKATI
jgi:hypothetical protein